MRTKKICGRCHVPKKIAEFHRDSSAKDGYAPSCRECRNFARNAKRDFKKVMDVTDFGRKSKEKLSTFVSRPLSSFEKISGGYVPAKLSDATSGPKNVTATVHKIEIEPETLPKDRIVDAMNAVISKHDCHFSLSVAKNGKTILQTHGSPQKTWKGTLKDLSALFDQVLS